MSLNHQQTAQPASRFVFSDRWLAESVRLGLLLSPPGCLPITAQQHTQAEQFARQHASEPEQRVLRWAQSLAQSSGQLQGMHIWRQRSAWMLMLMLVLAFSAGVSVALGILGDGASPVNVVWALGALLGVNLLMLMFWLATLVMTPGELSLGNVWLWLSRHFGGRDAVLLARSFATLSSRAGISRWWMAAVTHVLWSSLALGALVGLLLALSLRSFVFVWETTILPDSLFNTLVQGIGWLPAQLGFAIPDADAVSAAGAAGNNVSAQTSAQRVLWAGWLCGALLVYGVLPRLLLLLWSVWRLRVGLNAFRLDIHLAEWSELTARLSPSAQSAGVIDAEQPIHGQPAGQPDRRGQRDLSAQGTPLVVAFELSDQIVWPATQLSDFDQESVASRQQRINTLARLDQSPPRALLLVCDAAQTPDRGSLSWLADASGRALHVAVLLAGQGTNSRRQLWRQQLQTLGILSAAVFDDESAAQSWLEAHA